MAILELHAKLSFQEHYIFKIVDFIIILMFGIVKTLCNFQLDFECTFKLKCCSVCAMNEVKPVHALFRQFTSLFIRDVHFMCAQCSYMWHFLLFYFFAIEICRNETKNRFQQSKPI